MNTQVKGDIKSIEDIFSEHLEPIVPNNSFYSPSSNVSSYFPDFLAFSWSTWLIIILVLAFLGINVFVYLAKGTQTISDFLAPLLAKIAILFGNTAKKTVNVSA